MAWPCGPSEDFAGTWTPDGMSHLDRVTMSRPSRPPSVDSAVSSSRWQPRPSSLSKSITSSPEPAGNPSARWSARLQQRESLASRLASPRNSATLISEYSQRRQSLLRGLGTATERASQADPSSDNIQTNDKLASELCTAILKDRSAIDGRKSIRALRVWDAVARCLEEISGSINTEEFSVSGGASLTWGEPLSRASSRVGNFARNPRRTTSVTTPRQSAVHSPDAVLGYYGPKDVASAAGLTAAFAHEKQCDEPRVLYPCPFRKRNPARFNIRDHEGCARTQFSSILDLKRHILTHHQRPRPPHQCRRCRGVFDNQTSLEEHMLLPKDKMCDLSMAQNDGDPEDGLPDETERVLTASDGSVVGWTWESIWRLLFPTDNEVPDQEFHPVVELVEVEQALDDSQDALKGSLHDKLRLLLPDTVEDSYCTFLAGQLELVFETHRANIIRRCLSAWSGSAPSSSSSSPSSDPSGPNGPNGSAPINKSHRDSLFMKRTTRRSRRSTVLQSLQLTKGPTTGNTSETTPDASSQLQTQQNSKHTERSPPGCTRSFRAEVEAVVALDSESSPLRQRTSPLGEMSHNIRTKPSPRAFRPPLISPVLCDGDYGTATSRDSRDSRDSGIGIPCDVCESEVCRCRDIIQSLAGDKAESTTPWTEEQDHEREMKGKDVEVEIAEVADGNVTPPQTPAKDFSPKRHSIARKPIPERGASVDPRHRNAHRAQAPSLVAVSTTNLSSRPSLRHQPRLRLRTKDLNVTNRPATASSDTFGCTIGSADGFSPQSFKNRVLRTQQQQQQQQVRFPEGSNWTP